MKKKFRDVNFRQASIDIVDQANDILDEYAEQGYDLSLRQLYYQFVSKNLLKNTEQNYNQLGRIIADARDAGMIDWDMIRDRGRSVEIVSSWASPADIMDAASEGYRRNLWDNQTAWVLCMVEKQALEGVLEPVCQRERIAFSANKGYASASHLYSIGQTIKQQYYRNGKDIHVIYLGDHDPSGIDMSRDIDERLKLYSEVDDIRVHRVALNMDQVEAYGPPPNPAKMSDSRASGYVEKFGDESWELDALTPSLLDSIVTRQIDQVRDRFTWANDLQLEEEEKERLRGAASDYRDRYGDR